MRELLDHKPRVLSGVHAVLHPKGIQALQAVHEPMRKTDKEARHQVLLYGLLQAPQEGQDNSMPRLRPRDVRRTLDAREAEAPLLQIGLFRKEEEDIHTLIWFRYATCDRISHEERIPDSTGLTMSGIPHPLLE